MKIQISVDEKWPVFTLERPKNEGDPFVVEINDEFYKEYLYFSYKYHEYQTRIQVIYEHHQREHNELRERCFECFAESSKSTASAILNYVPEPTKAQV